MKWIKIYLLCIIGALALVACHDDDEDIVIEEVIPTYEKPDWKVDTSNQYPVSMSAIVTLSQELLANQSDGDMLAAFIGEECRGVGMIQEYGNKKSYFILIKGEGSEQAKLSFKYYNAKNSYLYKTDAFLSFITDTRYGSVDEPQVLNLQIMK